MATAPRVLIYDLETTHNILAKFDLKEEYTSHLNIIQERYIVTASWLWLGEKTIHSISVLNDARRFADDPSDDYCVVKKLVELFNDADVVVAHNGNAFDNKYVATRALFHGFKPTPPVTQIDTCLFARSKFMFNSNRLDYLARFLKIGGKMDTPTGLWLKALKGDRKAIHTMIAYNKVDVKILEAVFRKLLPFMPNYVNRELFGGTGCPRCGSKKMQYRGTHKAISREYRRMQCQACGGWAKEAKPTGKTTKTRIL